MDWDSQTAISSPIPSIMFLYLFEGGIQIKYSNAWHAYCTNKGDVLFRCTTSLYFCWLRRNCCLFEISVQVLVFAIFRKGDLLSISTSPMLQIYHFFFAAAHNQALRKSLGATPPLHQILNAVVCWKMISPGISLVF